MPSILANTVLISFHSILHCAREEQLSVHFQSSGLKIECSHQIKSFFFPLKSHICIEFLSLVHEHESQQSIQNDKECTLVHMPQYIKLHSSLYTTQNSVC